MIVLIDNYDSFSYNVYQLIGSVEPDLRVVRNDEVTIQELEDMKPEALILSPGPGRPEDAGICIESINISKTGCRSWVSALGISPSVKHLEVSSPMQKS